MKMKPTPRHLAEHALAQHLGIGLHKLQHAGVSGIRQKTLWQAAAACRTDFARRALSTYDRQLMRDTWSDAVQWRRLPTVCRVLQQCTENDLTPNDALNFFARARELRRATDSAAAQVDFLDLLQQHAIQVATHSFGAAAEIAFIRQCSRMGAQVAPIVTPDTGTLRADYDIRATYAEPLRRLIGRWSYAEIKMVQMSPDGRLPGLPSQKGFYRAVQKAERQIAASAQRLHSAAQPTAVVTCYWWSTWRSAVEVAMQGTLPRRATEQVQLMAHMIHEVARRRDGSAKLLFGFLDYNTLDPVGALIPIIP